MKCERCECEIPEELYSITERGLMLSAKGHWAPFSFCKSCKKELDSWFFEMGEHGTTNEAELKEEFEREIEIANKDIDLMPEQEDYMRGYLGGILCAYRIVFGKNYEEEK